MLTIDQIYESSMTLVVVKCAIKVGRILKNKVLTYQINTIYLCYTDLFKECVIHVKTKTNVCNYPITLAISTLNLLFQKYWKFQQNCEEKYSIFNICQSEFLFFIFFTNMCQSCQCIMYFCRDINQYFPIVTNLWLHVTCHFTLLVVYHIWKHGHKYKNN